MIKLYLQVKHQIAINVYKIEIQIKKLKLSKMKNLILAASVTLFAFSGVSAKNSVVSTTTTKKEFKKKTILAKCYRKAVDPFGNTYYVEVTCPKVIILQVSEDISQ